MLELRINSMVAQDLKEIRDYIAEDNPAKAAETIENIYKKMELLRNCPNIGALLSSRVTFKTDYKYFVWKNYVIIYKASDKYLDIYRIVNRYSDITRIFD